MNEPWGVGIIGAGPVTQAIHLPTLARLSDHFRVVNIMDVSAEVASAIAARTDARPTTTVQEVVGDPTVDVVAICSPPQFHATQVEAAIDAGIKGILCEKPFAVSTDEAMKLTQVARRSGVPIVVGAMHSYDPGWTDARALVGRLTDTAHTVRSAIALPPNSRYEDHASEIHARGGPPPGVDQTDPEVRAARIRGAILGLAVHDLPLIRRFAPTIDRILHAEAHFPFGYLIAYEGGGRRVEMVGNMHRGWRHEWTLEIWGEASSLRLDFTPSYVHAGGAVAAISDEYGTRRLDAAATNGYEAEWLHLAALLDGREAADGLDEAIEDLNYTLALADGAAEFIRRGSHL